MQLPQHHQQSTPNQPERGQALVEYVLIVVLVALIFGVALAATGGVVGNVFSNSIADLLRLTGTPTYGIPEREDYWLTVTFAGTPAQENPLPSNTPAPPTLEPTDGPSPTPTPTVPTPTPSYTRTPTLTPTPMDELFNVPFYDSVETQNLKWWRADPNINTSGDPWTLEFFNNPDLNGTPVVKVSNPKWLKIDFSGDGATSYWAEGVNPANFSVRLTRTVQLAANTTLTMRTLAADGIRASAQELDGAGNPVGAVKPFFDAWNANPTDPVWYTGSAEITGNGLNSPDGIKTRIIVEYRHVAGASRLYTWLQASAANPDDTYVNDAGNPGEGAFSCGYGQTFAIKGNDANTELGMWDSYASNVVIPDTQTVQDNADQPRNSRCFLELRGGVKVPVDAVNPQLIFWDVWDLKGPAQAWLEVANYEQATEPLPGGTPAPVPSVNRAALKWGRINLHPGNTRNYNWTRQVINLKNVKLSDGSNIDFTKPVTFRFVIQNTTSNDVNRWYIDDITVRDSGAEKVFKLNQPTWKLDEDADMKDFIFTGGKSLLGTLSGWRLTSVNKLGPSGMSFHDSVGINDKPGGAGVDGQFTDYKRHSQSNPTATENRDMRVHTLEFNGWIDLDPTVVEDAEGNKGEPVLAFYQAYDVGSFTGIEVQWTADPFTNPNPVWTTFPEGKIRDITTTGTTTSLTLQEKVILLKNLTGNPNRIRIRFALVVPHNATRRDGWWIDNIRIGREETPKWVDYPFYDNAQYFTSGPWRYNGKWAQTDTSGRRNADEPTIIDPNTGKPVLDPKYKRMSYSSSPSGTYTAGQKTYMEGRFPLDLKNDTHTDPTQNKQIWGRDLNTTPPMSDPNNKGGAAVNPILSFYHWRDLGNSDDIIVQWKRIDAPDTAWKTLWLYKNGMSTVPNSLSTETAKQRAWEYVEIDLTDMMKDINANDNAANKRDDDVIFRFYLDAKGTNSGNGVFIDDIRVFERPDLTAAPMVFKLWPVSQNRIDPITNQPLGTGNGVSFFDDPDASSTNRFWEQSWFNGGNWHAVEWSSRIGLFSFHDSPIGGQAEAPDAVGDQPYIGETGWFVPLDTFSTLELNNIIDLRGVDAVNDQPAIFFWNRYHLGGGNVAAVQVSEEMIKSNGAPYTDAELDNDIKTRCANQPLRQCYEQRRGWTPWKTVWSRTVNTNQEEKAYGWEREQVNLSDYGYNEELVRPGKRIRIRFVLNQLTNTTNPRDGWYIDNLNIRYAEAGQLPDIEIATDNLFSNASSMLGWVGEGNWGLDPNIFEGSGGSPVTFGTWTARWWDCTNCASEPGANGSYNKGTSIFLQKPDRPAPDFTNTVLGINYPLGTGKPAGAPTTIKNDRFVGEFILDTPVVSAGSFPPGNRVLLVVSDDGVRVKMQELVGGVPQGNPPWNSCIDNWKDQAPTTSTCTLKFDLGKQYRITIHYYEATSGATLTATIGEGKFSFSDSPQLAGSTATDKAPISFANTSLRLDQTLDMRNIPTNAVPVLIYRTKYRIGPNSTGRIEVSMDGGFSWEVNDMLDDPIAGYTFQNPNIKNAVIDPNPSAALAWQQRMHNLSFFKNAQIIIRFRLDRTGEHCARTIRNGSPNDTAPTKCTPTGGGGDEFMKGFFDGWWISQITVTLQ
jgi:Flp pilus assembly pilin Flp